MEHEDTDVLTIDDLKQDVAAAGAGGRVLVEIIFIYIGTDWK